jgi:transposase
MGKQHLIESKIGIALGMHRTGASQRAIAKELGVNQSTVSRLFRKVSITTFKTRGPRRVYKHSITNRESRRITRLALKLRRITIEDLINELGYNISKKTVRGILREKDIRKRIARTKPHLTQSHMSARLEWAKQHESWTIADWAKVIWSDESSIQIGFDPRQMLVFRRPGEELLSECLRPSFKSKRVNIMVWGCFAWDRLGPLIVCESGGIGGDEYFEILSDGLLSFVDDLFGPNMEDTIIIRQPNDIVFMHDGAPCHRSPAVAELLAEEGITVMKWPAQSPDLNPIENVWQILKVKFHKRFTDLRCSLSKSNDAIEKYGEVLKEVWGEINPTVLSNLIQSMPGRVQAVIKAKGGSIKY